MNRNARIVVAVLAGAAVVGAILLARSRVAPVPPVFDAHLSLRAGAAESAATGKPVLVFATADWCGPCQAFKRSTLVDPRVEELIRRRFVPVYLNIDLEQDAAATLNIRAIPASIILRDGAPSAKLEGGAPTDKYLAWLESALESPGV